jgi:hypothetical protein
MSNHRREWPAARAVEALRVNETSCPRVNLYTLLVESHSYTGPPLSNVVVKVELCTQLVALLTSAANISKPLTFRSALTGVLNCLNVNNYSVPAIPLQKKHCLWF